MTTTIQDEEFKELVQKLIKSVGIPFPLLLWLDLTSKWQRHYFFMTSAIHLQSSLKGEQREAVVWDTATALIPLVTTVTKSVYAGEQQARKKTS